MEKNSSWIEIENANFAWMALMRMGTIVIYVEFARLRLFANVNISIYKYDRWTYLEIT